VRVARQEPEPDDAAAGAEVDDAPVGRLDEVDEQERIDGEAVAVARLPQRQPPTQDRIARELCVGQTSSDGTMGLMTRPEASFG